MLRINNRAPKLKRSSTAGGVSDRPEPKAVGADAGRDRDCGDIINPNSAKSKTVKGTSELSLPKAKGGEPYQARLLTKTELPKLKWAFEKMSCLLAYVVSCR